jgi:glycosyltransferase involved in cell wall biosynthesis
MAVGGDRKPTPALSTCLPGRGRVVLDTTDSHADEGRNIDESSRSISELNYIAGVNGRIRFHFTPRTSIDSSYSQLDRPKAAAHGQRMTSPPRVALILPSLNGGGAEKVAIVLAQHFARQGIDVDLVLMRASGHLVDDVPAAVRIFDLEVDRVRWVVPPLIKYLSDRRPTSILSFMWPLNSAVVAAHFLARARARLVLTEHTDWAVNPLATQPLQQLLLTTTMRLTYPHALKVVAVSSGAADSLAKLACMNRSDIQVIYNPITPIGDFEAADQDIVNFWSNGDGPRLIAVGRLHPQKDYATLLRALAIVRETTDARLLILGDGYLRGQLEALCVELNLQDVVCMPGFVSNSQAYIELADLFVLSSAWEGFGNVLVEALASATPIVSTDCRSGPREILQDGRWGDLVPVGDAQLMAEAIKLNLAKVHEIEPLIERSKDFSIDFAGEKYMELLFVPDAQTVSSFDLK